MNRRSFFGGLAGILVLPAAAIAAMKAKRPQTAFRGVPIKWVPKLEADTQKPVYRMYVSCPPAFLPENG